MNLILIFNMYSIRKSLKLSLRISFKKHLGRSTLKTIFQDCVLKIIILNKNILVNSEWPASLTIHVSFFFIQLTIRVQLNLSKSPHKISSSSEQFTLTRPLIPVNWCTFLAKENPFTLILKLFSTQYVQHSEGMLLKAIQMEIFHSLHTHLKIYKI